jgi:hypothetical protein
MVMAGKKPTITFMPPRRAPRNDGCVAHLLLYQFDSTGEKL